MHLALVASAAGAKGMKPHDFMLGAEVETEPTPEEFASQLAGFMGAKPVPRGAK